MAMSTLIVASDGKPLSLFTEGSQIPSWLDDVTYTNPRTKQIESRKVKQAWAGTADAPPPEGAVQAFWKRPG